MEQPPQGFPPNQQPGLGQPQQPMQQQQPQAAPPAAPAQPQQAMPQYYLPDDQAEVEKYKKVQQEQASWGQGDGPKFVKIPGPRGEEKWSQVQVGAENSVVIRLLPPVIEGAPVSIEHRTHFWKSQQFPRGKQIVCGGKGCLICQVREVGLSQGDEAFQTRVKDFTKTRRQYHYNVALISDASQHLYPNGTYKSLILGAPATVHGDIGNLVTHYNGISKLVDPQGGRSLRYTRRKTGPRDWDVEYSIIAFDAEPLPQAFWFLLNQDAQWNLQERGKAPSQEEQMKAVEDMGFGFLLRGNGASYQPMPQAPNPNPYPQPNMMQAPAMSPPAMSPPPVASGAPVPGYQPQVGPAPTLTGVIPPPNAAQAPAPMPAQTPNSELDALKSALKGNQ